MLPCCTQWKVHKFMRHNVDEQLHMHINTPTASKTPHLPPPHHLNTPQVSPDGGLLQSSTVADMVAFEFAGGATRTVPGPYMEFAERLVMPEFAHVEVVEEQHRREGFEVGNADKIFESTSLARDGGGGR